MATTAYGVNHELAVKLWAKKLFREALKETYISRFMGTTPDSLVYVKNELNKSAGDRIRMGLRMQLSGAGIQGDSTLEGNEEALTTYADNVFIDQLRHAVRSDGEMSEQRVPFSVREEAMDGLRDWWADRLDTSFFNQIAGNTGQTDTRYTGNNTVTAPSTTAGNQRIILGTGIEGTEASLSASSSASGHHVTLAAIDLAVNQAKIASPMIRPLRVNGQAKYVAFLHPNQMRLLRNNNAANTVTWYDIMRARVQGGEKDSNPIFNGALGEYNGVILHESTRIPLAPNTTTVYRAVLCGAQAACFATGQRDKNSQMKWTEELFDYENQLGVSAAMIYGLKKTIFNSIDFATIVMSGSATAPTS